METTIQSYTSAAGRTSSLLRELMCLFQGLRRVSRNMSGEIDDLLRQLREVELLMQLHYGLQIKDLDVLEVGVGQLPRQIAYFARQNNVIGIDLDVIPTGANISQYMQLLQNNGTSRFIKTLARKMIGFDRRFCKELRQALDVDSLPRFQLQTMDAANTAFPDASFDFIYSFNVFEHLPRPAAVLKEIKRLLRPGGCAFTHLHLYTCDSGCHDVRILGGARGDLPLWPHLRPQWAHVVRTAAYINKYRITDWKRIFESEMPNSRFVYWPDKDEDTKRRMLAHLRAEGQLSHYSDDELLTCSFLSLWQKPCPFAEERDSQRNGRSET